MADKKYNDFAAGTYAPTDILLQADPITGALEKIEMSTMLNQRFGLEDALANEARNFDASTNAFNIYADQATSDSKLQLSTKFGVARVKLAADDGVGTEGIVDVTPGIIDLTCSDTAGTYSLAISAVYIRMLGLQSFASNAAAIAAGLAPTDLYIQAGLLAIVI